MTKAGPDAVTRIRVSSSRYNLSVSAHVLAERFQAVDPSSVALDLSSDIFPLSYVAGEVPTFYVTMTNHPPDPELVLRTVAAHLETFYDAVFT